MRIACLTLPDGKPTFRTVLLAVFVVVAGGGQNLRAAGPAGSVMKNGAAVPNSLLHSVKVRGKDDRTKITSKYTAQDAQIGVLYFPRQGGCTAFCVGPDVVMTAAHCFFKKNSNKMKTNLSAAKFRLLTTLPTSRETYSFIAGKDSQEAKFNVILGRRGGYVSPKNFRADWALVRLSGPVCSSQMKLVSLPQSKIISQAKRGGMKMLGYHGDRFREGVLLSPNCKLRNYDIPASFRKRARRDAGLGKMTMFHNCDGVDGSSGAPIVIATKDGLKAVAIHVGDLEWLHRRRKKRNGRLRIVGRWRENIAVITGPLMPLVEKLNKEKLLTSKAAFKSLQTALNKAGYKVGKVDGELGTRSKQAIRRFEKKNGQAQTGLPTHELLRALQAAAK